MEKLFYRQVTIYVPFTTDGFEDSIASNNVSQVSFAFNMRSPKTLTNLRASIHNFLIHKLYPLFDQDPVVRDIEDFEELVTILIWSAQSKNKDNPSVDELGALNQVMFAHAEIAKLKV